MSVVAANCANPATSFVTRLTTVPVTEFPTLIYVAGELTTGTPLIVGVVKLPVDTAGFVIVGVVSVLLVSVCGPVSVAKQSQMAAKPRKHPRSER